MAIGSTVPTVAFANETEYNVQNAQAQELASELKFYFEEAGFLDEDGYYYITNSSLLKDRAKSGDENAQLLLNSYYEKQSRSVKEFAMCIANDYFGVYIDLIYGKL